MKLVCRLFLIFVLFPFSVWGQHKLGVDDISLNALRTQDTLHIMITTSVPKMQLSFLMQGLNFTIQDSIKHPIISIEFPNARMVRDKIKHHPNEVKAMHKTTGDEVRPDLLPLIAALNDTCCIANGCDGLPICCSHTIALDKTSGEMTFSVSILPDSDIFLQDSVSVEILSSPIDMKSEFEGRKLSQENQMPPGGMGQAPANGQDSNRTIRLMRKIHIEGEGNINLREK